MLNLGFLFVVFAFLGALAGVVSNFGKMTGYYAV